MFGVGPRGSFRYVGGLSESGDFELHMLQRCCVLKWFLKVCGIGKSQWGWPEVLLMLWEGGWEWARLTKSKYISIEVTCPPPPPPPFLLLIYIYSSSPLLGVRSNTISFFCSGASVFYVLRAIVRCWTYSFYNTSRKPLFETHSFYHGKWNRLSWAHIFYNRFETRFFVRTVFTILFAKRCQKTLEKQCFLWMLWPETYKNQLFFDIFGKSLKFVVLSRRITQNRKKTLYRHGFYSKSVKIVVLSCKIDENRCKPLNCHFLSKISGNRNIIVHTGSC